MEKLLVKFVGYLILLKWGFFNVSEKILIKAVCVVELPFLLSWKKFNEYQLRKSEISSADLFEKVSEMIYGQDSTEIENALELTEKPITKHSEENQKYTFNAFYGFAVANAGLSSMQCLGSQSAYEAAAENRIRQSSINQQYELQYQLASRNAFSEHHQQQFIGLSTSPFPSGSFTGEASKTDREIFEKFYFEFGSGYIAYLQSQVKK